MSAIRAVMIETVSAALLATLGFAQNVADVNSSSNATSTSSGITQPASSAPSTNISRYEMYLAPSFLNTPKLSLTQRGFNTQIGVNIKRRLTVVADLGYLGGQSSIQPELLTPSLQQMLAAAVPPGIQIKVPYDSSTFTLGAGPGLNLRLRRARFVLHPSGGLIHESLTFKPSDPLTTQLVSQIVPGLKKGDTTIFYGAGVGLDIAVSKGIA